MDKEALTTQMDPVELRNVNMGPDDESSSGESAQDSYCGMENLEKAAMNRYEVKNHQAPWGKLDRFMDIDNKVFVRKN